MNDRLAQATAAASPAIPAPPAGASAARQRTELMLRAPVLPTLLRLAAPNVVVMLAQATANFLESYYVGRLGVEALAGAALVFPLVMLVQMMSAGGIGGGISSAIARALGAGRQQDAQSLALHAVVIALVLGLVSTLVVVLGGAQIYTMMGGRGEALKAALTYSNAIFAGAIFLWLLNTLASVLRGTGNMKLPAAVLTGGVFILLVLSPAFIFGFGPIPAMGIAGAGLALVAYYVIGTVVLMWSLLRGRGGFRLSFRHRLRWSQFAEILGVGGAAALNNTTANLAVTLATAFVAAMGTRELAGFGLGIRIEYLQIPIVFGVGSGMVAMIGMNTGAGQLERAREVAWKGACIAALATEVVGLAAAVFPTAWLHLFSTDAEAVATGTTYLRIVAPAYGLLGCGLALYFASQGAKRMRWSVIAGIGRVVVIALGSSLVVQVFGSSLAALCAVLVLAFAVFALLNAVPWMAAPAKR
ncbi:MATE family efflux transporter [Cupriavidus sp. 2TAF22]|uniref:MATE family efflux transporter n=1 Tax=unclassified Cupriavidus TaxID=2640874 RepID=UPI003F914798